MYMRARILDGRSSILTRSQGGAINGLAVEPTSQNPEGPGSRSCIPQDLLYIAVMGCLGSKFDR